MCAFLFAQSASIVFSQQGYDVYYRRSRKSKNLQSYHLHLFIRAVQYNRKELRFGRLEFEVEVRKFSLAIICTSVCSIRTHHVFSTGLKHLLLQELTNPKICSRIICICSIVQYSTFNYHSCMRLTPVWKT